MERRDFTLLVLAIVILLGSGARQMTVPLIRIEQHPISLSPYVLPAYALRTTLRRLAALVVSLVCKLLYATPAAKSRRKNGRGVQTAEGFDQLYTSITSASRPSRESPGY